MQLTKEQRKWIDELKSGRYNQCEGFLKTKNGKNTSYCCLGVACETFKRRCHLKQVIEESHVEFVNSEGGSYDSYLPYDIQDILRIDDSGHRTVGAPFGYYRFGDGKVEFMEEISHHLEANIDRGHVKHGKYIYWQTLPLISYNDSGMTFEQIAMILETYPSHYFTSDAGEAN